MMEESESRVAPREQAPVDRYGEALLYDFAKFLISLSLLVLGAMLTLSQAARSGDLKLLNIVFVLVALSFAAVTSFAVANSLVDARSRAREPSPKLPAYLKIATGLLGIGIGGFLMLWVDTLS